MVLFQIRPNCRPNEYNKVGEAAAHALSPVISFILLDWESYVGKYNTRSFKFVLVRGIFSDNIKLCSCCRITVDSMINFA